MAERYDAAIIGAGADGLVAAALLARAGLRVVVAERQSRAGGRLATREFHPGFHAPPFLGAVAPVPDALFWSLDLARRGALLAPVAPAVALAPDGTPVEPSPALERLFAEARRRREAALAFAGAPEPPPPRWHVFARPARQAWPAQSWTHLSIADLAGGDAALAAAIALEGRSADPLSAGSALHLLAAPEAGVWRGSLGGLGAALEDAARTAGAEILLGADVTDIRKVKDRAAVLALADGREIAARAILSTLDLKRTFLSLLPWSDLGKPEVARIGRFRIAGAGARLLLALSAPPKLPPALLRRAIHVAPALATLVEAHAAWRSGVVPERLPLTLRVESAVDPSLAPAGAAVLGVTIGAIPHTLFDGAWTREKRDRLLARALAALEAVLPGLGATVVGQELLVPPDLEDALGLTDGDLTGGALAPDQMFAYRPGFARKSPWTPVPGLYLAGPSSAAAPFATGAAGAIAAEAVRADLAKGRRR